MKIQNRFIEFIKFSAVGLVNTLISIVVFNILIYFDIDYMISTVISYIAGLINGYFCCSKFVFEKEKTLGRGLKFVLVYMSALIFNLGIMYVLVDLCKINPSLAQICTVGFNVLYNYTLNKLWTFS